jgi:hypothetical protein
VLLTAIPELIIRGMNQERSINREQSIELVFWNTRMCPILEGLRLNSGARMPGCGDIVALHSGLWTIIHTQMHSEIVGVPGRFTPVAAVFICEQIATANNRKLNRN